MTALKRIISGLDARSADDYPGHDVDVWVASWGLYWKPTGVRCVRATTPQIGEVVETTEEAQTPSHKNPVFMCNLLGSFRK